MCVCGQVMQGSTHYTHICSDVNAAATSKVSKLLITCFLVRVENGIPCNTAVEWHLKSFPLMLVFSTHLLCVIVNLGLSLTSFTLERSTLYSDLNSSFTSSR